MSEVPDNYIYGPVVALVTANDDPKKQGRVKLRYPWYDDKTESDWVRVVYMNAGPNHGFFAVPELKSEVVVAFGHGSMREPYVLGCLYNGKDAPPTDRQADDKKDEKLFRTRGGHQLLLRDTKNEKRVELKTDSGHSLTMDEPGKKVTLETQGGHKLELDEAGKKITLTTGTGQSVVIDGSGTVTLTAMTVKLDATQVELGKGAAEKVILGEKFMQYFNMHMHTGATGPTSPPTVPMLPTLLSQTTKTS